MSLEIPDYRHFAESSIFSSLADISKFGVVVDIPPLALWDDEKMKRTVIGSVYEHLREVLKASRFFHDDELKLQSGDGEFTIEYEDDKYFFSVVCSRGSIRIFRPGSSFKNFHEWSDKSRRSQVHFGSAVSGPL